MKNIMKQFRKHPLGAVGFAVLIFWVVIAVFAPMISPYSYTEINVDAQLLGPGDGHFLGTDLMGRDILSRIFEGSRSIILISLFTSIISTSLGILVGFTAGYIGGRIDELIMRIMDIFMAVPLLILAMVALAVADGANASVLVLVIALVFTPRTARVARSAMLTQKSLEYVDAARIRGESHFYIMFIEILPNTLGPILVEGSARFAYATMTVASLGFLGVGLQPPAPDWGRMVLENKQVLMMAPWSVIFPAIALASLVIGISFISDFFEKIYYRGD